MVDSTSSEQLSSIPDPAEMLKEHIFDILVEKEGESIDSVKERAVAAMSYTVFKLKDNYYIDIRYVERYDYKISEFGKNNMHSVVSICLIDYDKNGVITHEEKMYAELVASNSITRDAAYPLLTISQIFKLDRAPNEIDN